VRLSFRQVRGNALREWDHAIRAVFSRSNPALQYPVDTQVLRNRSTGMLRNRPEAIYEALKRERCSAATGARAMAKLELLGASQHPSETRWRR
jgi:hypothetical protein